MFALFDYIPPAFDYLARLALHQHLQGAFIAGNQIKSAIGYAGVNRANAMNDQVIFQASAFDHLSIYAAPIVFSYVIPLSTTAISNTDVLHKYLTKISTSILHINIPPSYIALMDTLIIALMDTLIIALIYHRYGEHILAH